MPLRTLPVNEKHAKGHSDKNSVNELIFRFYQLGICNFVSQKTAITLVQVFCVAAFFCCRTEFRFSGLVQRLKGVKKIEHVLHIFLGPSEELRRL